MFAASIERLRKAAGLTQAELAVKSGVSQPHVSVLKRGAWEPSIATTMALAVALGVEPASLLSSLGESIQDRGMLVGSG